MSIKQPLLVVLALLLSVPAQAAPRKRARAKPKANAVPLRIDASKIGFAKAAKIAPVKAKAPRWGKALRAPAPLPRAEKQKVITRIRGLAAEAGVVLQPLPAPGPDGGTSGDDSSTTIALTPDAPRQGKNWLGLRVGSAAPGGFLETGADPAYDLRQYGYYRLHFEDLSQGSLYLLDCSVDHSTSRTWSLYGSANASVKPQAGHLLFGFSAASSSATFTLQPDDILHVRLYRCELLKAG